MVTTSNSQFQVERKDILVDECVSVITDIARGRRLLPDSDFDAIIEIARLNYGVTVKVFMDFDISSAVNRHGTAIGTVLLAWHPQIGDELKASITDPKLEYLIRTLDMDEAEYKGSITEAHSRAMHYKMVLLQQLS